MEVTVNGERLRLVEAVTGYAYGQTDAYLAFVGDREAVAWLDYTIYRGAAHIRLIEVRPAYRRAGLGRLLMRELARLMGSPRKIHPGYRTDDGVALTRAVGAEWRDERRAQKARQRARVAWRNTGAAPDLEGLVRKYMRLLGTPGPVPRVIVRANLGSRWLGRWSWRQGTDPIIEVQRSILGDARTIERVLAHEACHHHQFAILTPDQIRNLRVLRSLGVLPGGHGHDFLALAERVNAAAGAGFVTVKSDQEYIQAPLGREFLVLVAPLTTTGGRLGWQWAARLGPKAKQYAEWVVGGGYPGAKLVTSSDERWTRGPKIGRGVGWSVPRTDEDVRALHALVGPTG